MLDYKWPCTPASAGRHNTLGTIRILPEKEKTMDWLVGAAPIALLVLMCPLMMIFMMRGMHGGHGSSTKHRENPANESGSRSSSGT